MTMLPDYAEALDLALRDIAPLGRLESVPLDAAGGRVLAEDVHADRDYPPFNRAQMDGYAVRAAEVKAGAVFDVVKSISAGMSASVEIPEGACVAIATGAPLPGDVDAVVPHEQSDRGSPVTLAIESIAPGHAVHARGADARKGDGLIKAGTMLAAQHLGIAAAVGASLLRVSAKPQIVVLTSGDEVVDVEVSPQPHQIRNSNGPMVSELIKRFGAELLVGRHLLDDRAATINAVRTAIAIADVVVTVGGVSAGERDHFPAAFDACGVKRFLRGASIQPGRPIVVGVAPGGAVVVGLPGNPVSALACSCLFAWPVVRRLLNMDVTLPWREIELAEPVKPNPNRRAFRPAVLIDGKRAIVPSWAGSGDLVHTSPTHGLVELPVQEDAVTAGTGLRFLPWP
jgi:molybdopterin molybdotransferase